MPQAAPSGKDIILKSLFIFRFLFIAAADFQQILNLNASGAPEFYMNILYHKGKGARKRARSITALKCNF